MTVVLSNADALLVAMPMLGILFAGFFRLDELFGRTQKKSARRPLAGGMDHNGMPICMDPDGKPLGRMRRKSQSSRGQRN